MVDLLHVLKPWHHEYRFASKSLEKELYIPNGYNITRMTVASLKKSFKTYVFYILKGSRQTGRMILKNTLKVCLYHLWKPSTLSFPKKNIFELDYKFLFLSC